MSAPIPPAAAHARMRLMRAQIDTYHQPVVYMRRECSICRSEGFAALTRIAVRAGGREIVAVLNVVTADWLPIDVAALSDAAWRALDPGPALEAELAHPSPAESVGALRAKVFGRRLLLEDFRLLMRDAVASRLSDIELAAFVAACAGDGLDQAETTALTQAMVDVGERIDWGGGVVLDKHCVGGLPGNRTTPILVAIVAALGHRIPKTSSRAITSPAGTADTMSVMTNVDLDLAAMRRVVERENGCVVWGGRVRLSPADDVLIQVERPLDFDSDGQLVASILSKKIAAGSSHVVIDIPIGPTAKVRSTEAAASLARRLSTTAQAFGLRLAIHESDGRQPVGVGIGPALEARDVLAVLRCEATAPQDLRERALDLAAALLDLAPGSAAGQSRLQARRALDSGDALSKFMAICDAQGGFREPRSAPFQVPVLATAAGRVTAIDNRRLGRVAKLAGAPVALTAGVECWRRLGDVVSLDEPLFTIHAESPGELQYALTHALAHPGIVQVSPEPA